MDCGDLYELGKQLTKLTESINSRDLFRFERCGPEMKIFQVTRHKSNQI